MLFLAEFSVIKPEFGLFFWTLVIFVLFYFIMSRLAFKPIAEALRDREAGIAESLAAAENARKEMANLKAENEKIAAQAREERNLLIKEAKDTSSKIVAEAREQAKVEAQKIVTSAMNEIENQKQAAMAEVKSKAGVLALDIAEKVLRKQLTGNAEQEAFVSQLVKETNLN
jgi:F-type H+-transporting ATPase subunit b